MRRLPWLLCVVGLLAAAAAAPAEEETRYYALRMAGKKVGHVKHVREVAGGKVANTQTMRLKISRAGMPLVVRVEESCLETADGKPLGFESVTDMGLMAMSYEGRIDRGKVTATVTTGGQVKTRSLDWPEGAVLTEGARRIQKAKGLKPGTRYTIRTFMPSLLQSVEAAVVVGETRKVDLLGRVVPLTELTTTVKLATGTMNITEYVDADLEMQKSVMPMMGMEVELIACSRAFALSDDDVVDFLDKLMVASPRPLKGVSEAKAVTYHLAPTTETKLKVPATDNQSVRAAAGGSGTVVVTVRPVAPPQGAAFPYQGDSKAAREALKPTRFLQSDAKTMVSAARKAVGDAPDAADAARRIEAFVRKHIDRKDLSVGYASAPAVLDSGQGDCTEHAVLVAALCRAVGIPARVVCGVAYVPRLGRREHLFGPHAWAEAYVGGKWIGLDAALTYGAGHVTLSTSDGNPEDFFGVCQTLGCFRMARVAVER